MDSHHMSTLPRQKSDLVFIHGAWASGWAWQKLLPHLNTEQVNCHVISLPDSSSFNASSESQATLEDYVSSILKQLSLIARPAWLIAHSGGGMIATAVAEARPRNILGIIYVAGMMLPSGRSFPELCDYVMAQGTDASGISPYLEETLYGTQVSEAGVREVFLHDAEEHDIQAAIKNMVVQPNAARKASVYWSPERAGRVPTFYILAEDDRSLVKAVQQEMINRTPPQRVLTLPCGHFPQIVMPEALARYITEIISP